MQIMVRTCVRMFFGVLRAFGEKRFFNRRVFIGIYFWETGRLCVVGVGVENGVGAVVVAGFGVGVDVEVKVE